MSTQRDWPLLTLIGLTSGSLVLLGVVIVRGIQQGRAIDALHRRLETLERGGGANGQGLHDGQLRQLGERLRRLEDLANRLDPGEPLVPSPAEGDPLLPSPMPLGPGPAAGDPAPAPLELPPPRSGRGSNGGPLPGLPLRPPSRGAGGAGVLRPPGGGVSP